MKVLGRSRAGLVLGLLPTSDADCDWTHGTVLERERLKAALKSSNISSSSLKPSPWRERRVRTLVDCALEVPPASGAASRTRNDGVARFFILE